MKLKSFGCSFVFGTDLHDNGKNGLYTIGSHFTWPALIAKDLGYKYQTFARPGSGNLQILERVMHHAVKDDPGVYIISWTWIDRFDYIDSTVNAEWRRTKWKTLMPIDDSSVAKSYYKNLHSEFCDKFCSLLYIKMAIDILKEKRCKFIMTYMDDLIFDTRWNVTGSMMEIMEYIQPYLTRFDGKNFLDWSRDKGFKISDMSHPLEDAHRAAADLVLSQWDFCIKS